MAVIAGIDEAGFGPIVGPLVVSAAVFSVPDAIADRCLWQVLAGAVTRKSIRKSPALPVADSKAMHVRSDGPVHLERGVLGMLAVTAPPPGSLRELLRRVAPGGLEDMRRYPWYADGDLPLPFCAGATDVALRANGVREAMNRSGVEVEAVRAQAVLAGDYNRLVRSTRNKAVALLGVTSRLIAYAFATHAVRSAGPGDSEPRAEGPPTRIIVDRLGGRLRYLPALQRMFQGARIRIIEESARRSAYFVDYRGRSAEICFITKGEQASMPVALASMVSKYLRELLMELLNRWWGQKIRDLKPTAGYYVDGRRFLRDIEPALSAEGIDRSLLVRSR